MTEIGSYLFTKLMAAGLNPVEALQRYDNQLYLDEAVITAVGSTLGTTHGNVKITYTPATATTPASISFVNGEAKVEIEGPKDLIQAVSESLIEDNYSLNDQEKAILNTLSLIQIIAFATDTQLAQIATDVWYYTGAKGDPAGCPNAFKHALLAAYRVYSHGYTIAKSLTDAHETGDDNYDPNNIDIGSQMDFANNAIGLHEAANVPYISIDVRIHNLAQNHQLWQVNFSNETNLTLMPSCP